MLEVKFGVVVVNWNGADDAVAALDSLLFADPRPDHVVLVDNGSDDDSLHVLRAWCNANAPSWNEGSPVSLDALDSAAWLILIPAGRNLGFSGANNVGLGFLSQRTAVSHFVLLNNDATVAVEYFKQIAGAIHQQPEVGLLGSLIYRHPQRDTVWYAGGREIHWRALIVHLVQPPTSEHAYPTPFVTGCAMVISRPLYNAEGGLAEVYNPIYWEDADYSHRARAGGWRVVVVPRAHVYHRVGASAGGERLTPRIAFFQNRNRAIYVRRNYHGANRLLALSYLVATKPARAVVELARGRGALGGAIFRGFVRGMTQAVT